MAGASKGQSPAVNERNLEPRKIREIDEKLTYHKDTVIACQDQKCCQDVEGEPRHACSNKVNWNKQ